MTEPKSPTQPAAGVSRRRLLTTGLAASAATASGVLAGAPAHATGRAATRPRRVATVIRGGRVYAGPGVRGGQQAIALDTRGRIVGLGSDREVRRLAGRGTEVVDANGGTIMSGIVDGHVHPLGAAAQSLNPSLENGSYTVPQLQARLQEFLTDSADKEPDGWLTVTDWSPVGLLPNGTVADRSQLDALDTKRPILLQGSDFHNVFVNSRALEVAGVTDSTPNPAGGEIVRDASGRATGLLKDTAQDLVRRVIPPPGHDELYAAYREMVGFLLSQGITSFQDAAAGPEDLAAYAELKAAGHLPQRVTPALALSDELIADPKAALRYLARMRRRYGDAGLDLTTTKLFVDGVIEFPAQTAALLEPYLDEDGRKTDNRGDLYIKPATFEPLATALHRAGWQIHAHALGDRAVRVALDAIERAQAARRPRPGDLKHTLAHLQLVHPADYPRFAALGVLANMQLQWAERNEWTLQSLKPFIGRERFRRMYPAGSLARAGAWLVGGSDWPVDPMSTMNQIATAVDRSGPGKGRKPLLPREAITRAESLAMHTRGSAHQLHGGRAGLLEEGNAADVIVLDRDLQAGPVGGVRRAEVRQTVIGGRVVYDARQATDSTRGAAAIARLGGGDPHATCCRR